MIIHNGELVFILYRPSYVTKKTAFRPSEILGNYEQIGLNRFMFSSVARFAFLSEVHLKSTL